MELLIFYLALALVVSFLCSILDVVETLLGIEIVDEFDDTEDLQKMARQQWIERAKRLGIVLPESLQDEE